VLQTHRRRDAEDLAGRDIAHHHLLPGRRGLAGADMAVQQQEEGMGGLALRENLAVSGIARRAGLTQDLGKFCAGKAREHRQIGHQRRVNRGHMSSVVSSNEGWQFARRKRV
jgi:hypothetical protein